MTRAVLVAALLITGCATTAPEVASAPSPIEPARCATLSDYANQLLAQVPVAEFKFFDGPRAAQIIDRLNRIPPATGFTADTVLFASAPGKLDHIALFATGCFVASFGLSPAHRSLYLAEPIGWTV